MQKNLWCLNQVNLFQGLPCERLEEVEGYFSVRHLGRGDTVYQACEDGKVYLIKTGKVEVYIITPEGQKYIIDILGPGSIFGNLGLECDDETFVETLEETTVCAADKEVFLALISEEPTVARRLLVNLFDKVLAVERKAASYATDNVLQRFVKLMLSLGRANGSAEKLVTDRYTHEQLSHMLGVSRQTITTLINDLEREGKLERNQKRLVFKKQELQSMAN